MRSLALYAGLTLVAGDPAALSAQDIVAIRAGRLVDVERGESGAPGR